MTASSACGDLTALAAEDAAAVVYRIGDEIGLELEPVAITSYCVENPSARIAEAARAVVGIGTESASASTSTAGCDDCEAALGSSTMNPVSLVDEEHAYALGNADGTGYFPLSGGERVAPGMPEQAVLFVWAA